MLGLLQQRAAVLVFDRGRRSNARARELFRQLLQVGRFVGACLADRELTLYLALSGGNGQLLDSLYILVSRLCRQRVFVHHHSFAYVNDSTFVNRALFTLLRKQFHIVLSRGMAAALTGRYRLDERRMIVMSNAAFFSDAQRSPRSAPEQAAVAPICVGFLSNITFDKGFVEFFAVLARLRDLQVDYRAYVAGPVAPEARQEFDRLYAAAADTEYVGALYGTAKDQFYRQLDVLLFPTKYANEAEPLVIHEALRSGVYVIACNRGAIADTLENGAGLVFMLDSFVESAAASLRSLSSERGRLTQAQDLAIAQAQRLRDAAGTVLGKLLTEITLQ
jgi:glycosyltransferase involved in cell wall biosynthesis